MNEQSMVFPALLKYWRNRRGMSQLDLALTADVSARHISFLETGRSKPSEDMVLLLAATLDLPLRERNTMLREAGFSALFEEPDIHALDPDIEHAIQVMLRQHEPYPMLILNRCYDVLRMNKAAACMISMCLGHIPDQFNIVRAFFDEEGFKPYVVDWESTAQSGIARLQREVLQSRHDQRLRDLLDTLLASPDIPASWRDYDLSKGHEGTLSIRFKVQEHILSFVATVTSFQAPQNVTLEEIQIESYFPTDETTEALCKQFLAG